MLQDIRQQTKSGWTYILVGMLIVVFAVFFGVPGDACGGGQSRVLVAEVADEEIHSDEVNLIYNRVFGGQRGADESQTLRQQAQSLRSLILIHLLAERAEQLGLRVSEEEFVAYIKDPLRNPEFLGIYGQDGSFDGPFYKAYIQNQLRIAIPKYEDFKRKELLAQKYVDLLEMQFQPLPGELEDLHQLRNTEVNLEFVKFDPAQLQESITIDDAAVAAYLQSNADKVAAYYAENEADYSEEEQVQYRRIFLLKPTDAESEEAREAAAAKFAEAKRRVLEEGENFADVAGEITEDFAKEKQGLMDWTTWENMDQNIAGVLRDAQVGDVKEVETDFAYMLVKLEDKKEAKKTPLAEVRDDIARKLIQEEKVDETIAQMVAKLRASLGDGSFADALASLQEAEGATLPWDAVTTGETGMFTLEGQDMSALFGDQIAPGMARMPWDRVPKIGKSPELARDAFELTEENPVAEETYTVNDARFLVRLQERSEATEEKLAEAKPKLIAEVRQQKLSGAMGSARGLFFGFPSDDYGPFIENLYAEALEDGEIQLYDRNYQAAQLVKRPGAEADAPVEVAPAKAAEEPAEAS